MTAFRRRKPQPKRATARHFASTTLLLLRAAPAWIHGASAAAAGGGNRSAVSPSAPCLDRAFRRLWSDSNYAGADDGACEQPHLATDFCHGPVGAPCRVVDDNHPIQDGGTQGRHPRRPGPDTCSLVTHAVWVESHFLGSAAVARPEEEPEDMVVVLPAGTCRGPLRQGPFRQEWLERNQTLIDEPVVTMHINGSRLLQLLEHLLELRHVHLQRDVQPRVSGMQFWVRPRRNRTRISGPAVLGRSSCRWKPVQPSQLYAVVTVPSLIKASRRRLVSDVSMHPVRVSDDKTTDDHLNGSVAFTVVGAVTSYVRRACRVEDPSQVVSGILSGGRRGTSSGRGRKEVIASAEPPSPVCDARSSPNKKNRIHANARTANRTHHHSRLATW